MINTVLSHQRQRLIKVFKQIINVFNAHRKPNQIILDAHFCSSNRTDLIKNGMGNWDGQRPHITQVGGLDHRLQLIQEAKTINVRLQLDTQNCSGPTEQVKRPLMLRMPRQSWVIHLINQIMALKEFGNDTRIIAARAMRSARVSAPVDNRWAESAARLAPKSRSPFFLI